MKILKLFLIWRVFLFIPVILGFYFLDYGNSLAFFEISKYQKLSEFFSNYLFSVWANFDGVHYLNIALDGYKDEARFFPLLPMMVYLLSFGGISTDLTFLIGIVLPNLFFAGALFVFLKLLRLDYSDKFSQNAILYLILFPTAFFFISLYTEGLFLLLLLSSFLFAREKKWFLAIITAFLLCTTRFVGIFIIPALVYEMFLQENKVTTKNFLKFSSIIFLIPLGLISFAFYNYQKWGNSFYFLTAHSELGNSRSSASMILPLQTVYRYFKIFATIPITQFEFWLSVLELMTFLFGTVFIYIAWKKVRPSYLIFSVPAFFLPVLSGTFSGLPRYILILFPIFIAMALTIPEKFKRSVLILSSTLLFILLLFFTKAYFIA